DVALSASARRPTRRRLRSSEILPSLTTTEPTHPIRVLLSSISEANEKPECAKLSKNATLQYWKPITFTLQQQSNSLNILPQTRRTLNRNNKHLTTIILDSPTSIVKTD